MPAKLYVGNIAPSCSQDELQSLFSKYGNLLELDIVKNFAFVHFDRESDAQKAVRELHDTFFLGSKLLVQFSKKQDINRGNKSVSNSFESMRPPHREPSRESRPTRDHRSHRDHDRRSSRINVDRVDNGYREPYRSKPYDRPPPSHSLDRVPQALAAALQPRPGPESRAAAYADYFKAASAASPHTSHLTPARGAGVSASQLAAARAAALAANAYYEQLLEHKDRRLDVAPTAPSPPMMTPAAYAAFYRESVAAKDPFVAAQAALERYAPSQPRSEVLNPYAAGAASGLRHGGFPPYR